MKKIITLTVLLFTVVCFSQKEGQGFCEGNITGEYFPLTIKTKKIIWADTHYIENQEGTKNINGKNYQIFRQTWENGDSDILYMRKDKDAVIQYYQDENIEALRYNEF